MKVVFIPDYRNDNSYQTYLSNSLAQQGVHVNFNHGGFLSILRSVIKYWKPDILHIHWTRSFMIADSKIMTIIKSICFICELLILKLFRIKIIWTVHNIVDHEGDFRPIESLFTKFFAKLCDRLIVHCHSVKSLIQDTYGKDLHIAVVPHGNYMDLKNTITLQDARKKLNIDMDDTVFLYFGRIRLYKGLPELIETFKKLNSQKVKMLIVGKSFNDQITVDIKNLCKDDIRIKNILEFIPNDDIQIYTNAANVVVLPFRDILTSGSIILSMSFGKPIVAPKIGCIKDTLDDKGSFLYTENNLMDAMQRVLNTDRKTLQDMGKHNFGLAEEFGWDKIAERTHDVYRGCVTG